MNTSFPNTPTTSVPTHQPSWRPLPTPASAAPEPTSAGPLPGPTVISKNSVNLRSFSGSPSTPTQVEPAAKSPTPPSASVNYSLPSLSSATRATSRPSFRLLKLPIFVTVSKRPTASTTAGPKTSAIPSPAPFGRWTISTSGSPMAPLVSTSIPATPWPQLTIKRPAGTPPSGQSPTARSTSILSPTRSKPSTSPLKETFYPSKPQTFRRHSRSTPPVAR